MVTRRWQKEAMAQTHDLPARFANLKLGEFSGEKVLYAAEPDARRAFLYASLIWIFAIPWTAFALFWEGMVLGPFLSAATGGPDFLPVMMGVMALFGVPFVLVGFGMLGAPFWQFRKARRTVHVITDRRLATVVVGPTMQVESFRPREIGTIARSERADGSGSLKVGVGRERDSEGDVVAKTHHLVGVPDVRRAETLLLGLKDAPAQR